jgi:putative DNA primase/helicase
VETVIESDAVATALRSFMADRIEWSGTASELLGHLSFMVSEPERRGKAWPTAPNKLSGRLRRQAPFLRHIGIQIDDRRTGTDALHQARRKSRKFTVSIVRVVSRRK